MPLYTQSQAQAFFDQLTLFSSRVFGALKLPPKGSPFGGAKWSGASPTGAIIHWTADDDLESTIAWFADPTAQVSAHCVVADRPLSRYASLCQDLPLVRDLPVTVIQCRPVTTTAWHSCYMNGSAYGIENVNVGRLQTVGGLLTWDDCGKARPYRSDKSAQSAFGRVYEPYTTAQVNANLTLLQYVDAYFGGNVLNPTLMLGHENVESLQTVGAAENKTDPGPCFPLHALRDAFIAQATTVSALCCGSHYAQAYRIGVASSALKILDGTVLPYNAPDLDVWAKFMAQCARPAVLVGCPAMWVVGLACLGYRAPCDKDSDLRLTVCAFQRLMGLTADGQFGPKSAAALYTRLRDRFGVP
jgi:N-acetyl-anhydromuramyl-L-alanine amidase AmpD